MTKDQCQYIGSIDRTRAELGVTVKHHKNWVRCSEDRKMRVLNSLTKQVGKGYRGEDHEK